jgi:phospholipid/cholesterol/gamma-HCH transport system substrate-binding protein
METRASYVTVGAFVMVCLIGVIVAMLWIAGAQFRQEFSFYRTYFTGAVTGLGRGTIVRYNGVDVGNVRDLAFDPDNPRSVNVTLQIDPTLPIHVDSITSLEMQGLTGGVYVEIAGGTASSPLLTVEPGQDYPVIPSRQSTLQQLAQAGPELLGKFSAVGDRVGDLLNDDNRRALSETLISLRDTMAQINKHSEDLGATIENMRMATAGIGKTLGNVDNTLGNVDHTLTTADHALTSVDTALGSLNKAINSADATVTKLGRLSDDADKVVNGQGVAQMTQLVAQTRALVASLTRLTSDLEREPTRLIFGDQRQGYTPK